MKLSSLILAGSALVTAACSGTDSLDPEHTIWFDSPATMWEATLPLGNGRLGMMPDGGICEENIVLNEISLWSGCEVDYGNPDAAESLKEIRQLLLEGKNDEAQSVMYRRFVPKKQTEPSSASAEPPHRLHYLPTEGFWNTRKGHATMRLRLFTTTTEDIC